MAIDPKKLRRLVVDMLMEDDDSTTPGEHGSGEHHAALPFLSGVLYTQPNPDGSLKRCGNCANYATDTGRCYIHAEDVEITPAKLCGYHVFSPEQLTTFTSVLPLTPVLPELSGLREAGEGHGCQGCHYYAGDEQFGDCLGVVSQLGGPAPVEAKGLCARFETKEA